MFIVIGKCILCVYSVWFFLLVRGNVICVVLVCVGKRNWLCNNVLNDNIIFKMCKI